MQNNELISINFVELLDYGGMPVVRNMYEPPLECKGFCVACEDERFVPDSSVVLEQMSHGADTSDYESLLGELPTPHNHESVVFLLESPGGYYENGEPRNYKGIIKEPPVRHYYWTPPEEYRSWPDDPYSLGNPYGPYFAYLVNNFHLKNAYFTNVVKCSLAVRSERKFIPYCVVRRPTYRDTRIRNKCFELYLYRELKILEPRHIFCFGSKVEKMLTYVDIHNRFPKAAIHRLYHPAARISWKRLVDGNNAKIDKALRIKCA
jgi:hypothetical protein